MDRQEKKKRKKISKATRSSSRYRLDILWNEHKSDFSARNLVLVAREIDFPEIQKSALREFLNRDNLSFADFYRVLGLPEEVLKLDLKLEDEIWKQCFDICTSDNLRELLYLGEGRASEELFQRIDKGAMSMPKAKQILISLFEKSDDKKIRDECWKRIELIGPNEDELKYLLDSEKSRGLSRLIERMLAKRAQKKEGKAISRIKELVGQIKQGQE